MKDVYALLRQKEADYERVRREVQALLLVIPLLADDPRPWDQSAKEAAAPLVAPQTVLLGGSLPDPQSFQPPWEHPRSARQ